MPTLLQAEIEKLCSHLKVDYLQLIGEFETQHALYKRPNGSSAKNWLDSFQLHLLHRHSNAFYSAYTSEQIDALHHLIETKVEELNDNDQDIRPADRNDELSLEFLISEFVRLSSEKEPYSLWNEFLSMSSRITIWLFWRPLLVLRRKMHRFRLASLLENKASDGIWSTIERGSAIQNYFLFKIPYYRELRGDSYPVDLCFLLLQTGDEFIDGLLNLKLRENQFACVESEMIDRLSRLEFSMSNSKDGPKLIVSGIKELSDGYMDLVNEKYDESYGQLLLRVECILEELNRCLKTRNKEIGTYASICWFLNFCLETALDDLHLVQQYENALAPLSVVKKHFVKKTELVMSAWIGLRAQILDLPFRGSSDRYSFGALLHTCQVFDDLKDVVVDYGYQANILLSVANEFYPDELTWFKSHVDVLPEELSIKEQCLLALNMPMSMIHVYTYARVKGLTELDWLTLKGSNGGWFRNWMGRGDTCVIAGIEDGFSLASMWPESEAVSADPVLDLIITTSDALDNVLKNGIPIDIYWSYVFDLLYHDDLFAKVLHTRMSIKERYLFSLNGFFMSADFKCGLLKKVIVKQRSSTNELMSILESKELSNPVRSAWKVLME